MLFFVSSERPASLSSSRPPLSARLPFFHVSPLACLSSSHVSRLAVSSSHLTHFSPISPSPLSLLPSRLCLCGRHVSPMSPYPSHVSPVSPFVSAASPRSPCLPVSPMSPMSPLSHLSSRLRLCGRHNSPMSPLVSPFVSAASLRSSVAAPTGRGR